ncbi:MAG: hypothetical protein WBW33_04385 [Bryobacteraceae bacterium]
MSTITMPESALASEDWQLETDAYAKPVSLLVQLRRQAYVLPWFRFVHAEGDNTQVKITFASYLVTVNGHGLAALLAALAAQRVIRLIQPSENEAKFGVRGEGSSRYTGPGITEIKVEELK